jgi:hypothetical protein
MKMTRTEDLEQGEISFAISGFPFRATIKMGALPNSLRAIQIADSGGVVHADTYQVDGIEQRACKMLFDFYRDNVNVAA